jgi:RHS repeat-associated protein
VAEFPAHLFRLDGDPGEIRASAGKWSTFGQAATDAAAQINGVDTGEFVGPEGDLFREGMNKDMPRHLSITGDAFGKVSTALTTFASTLEGLQGQMRPLATKAPGLWEALQAARGRVDRAEAADAAHARELADRDPGDTSPETYRSDSGAASGALSSAQAEWDAAVGQANGLRGQMSTAVGDAVRVINTAKDMRFKENPKWWDIGGQFQNFVRDNKDLLQKLSGALKIVSLVAGLLSFIPVLAPIMGPIALGSALLASAIDLSIYAATGEGSLKTILIDVGLNLLPGVGKLARIGLNTMKGGRLIARAGSMMSAVGGRYSALRGGLSNLRRATVAMVRRGLRLDPIDVASGEMVLSQTDVELAAVLPLVLSRTHVSTYSSGRWFGRSWTSTLDQRVEVDDEGVCFAAEDGMLLTYVRPAPGLSVLPQAGPRWPLREADGGYQIVDVEGGRTLHFADVPGTPAPASASAGGSTVVLPLVAITDRVGHRIDMDYDDDGAVAAVRHSGGYHIRVEIEDRHVVALSLLHRTNSGEESTTTLVRYRYDEGRLSEIVNSSGLPLRLDYDDEERIVRWVDRNGSEYGYIYDDEGRCIATTGSGGCLAGRIHYDTQARTTTVTDSLGQATTYVLDEDGNIVREVDPLGGEVTRVWGPHGRLTSKTDQLGRVTLYRHDGDGNLAEIVRTDGAVARIRYNALAAPVQIVDYDGGIWYRSYDDRGLLTSVTDPTGAATRYEYDTDGHLGRVVDPLGNATRITANAAGLVESVTDATGATLTYHRDPFGRVVSVTDPLGAATRYGYTMDGRVAWRRGPDGAGEDLSYDPEGNLVARTDAAGRMTRFEIGLFDLISARIEPDGTRYEFGYDTELRLVTVRNPQGLVWRYEYDAAGRMVSEVDFNGRTLQYELDAAGQLIARTNGIGQVTRYSRDPLGNISAKDAPEGRTTFTYDAAGFLSHAANADVDLAIERDMLGRVLAETVNGRTLCVAYDSGGRRVRRRTPSGIETTWTYDGRNRPTILRQGEREMSFAYDAAGREISRATDSGVQLNQLWDPTGRLLEQVLGVPGHVGPANRRSYRYQLDGLLVSVDDRLTGVRRFAFDPAGRVTSVSAGGWTERYAYDDVGNLTHAEAPASRLSDNDDSNRTLSYSGTLVRRAGRTRYEHDGQGRVTLRQRKQLSAKPLTWRYSWNSDDRLTEVVTPDGSRWSYVYDPLGRRTAKARAGANGDPAERIDFTWDGNLLVEQVRGDSADSAPEITVWEYAPGTFTPIAQTDVSRATQDNIDARFYAIVTNLAGAPTELVDQSGTPVWQVRTTLWGEVIDTADAGPDCPLRFPGQYHDSESGLHYNNQRYYDPTTGRYQSADPLGLSPAPNPHAYVSNPITEIDPIGLQGCGADAVRTARARWAASGETVAGRRTVAVTRYDINGRQSDWTPAVSGEVNPSGSVPLPANTRFNPVGPNGEFRPLDAERKLLEDIANQFPADATGRIDLYSERMPCGACSSVIDQFRQAFPNIELNVTYG